MGFTNLSKILEITSSPSKYEHIKKTIRQAEICFRGKGYPEGRIAIVKLLRQTQDTPFKDITKGILNDEDVLQTLTWLKEAIRKEEAKASSPTKTEVLDKIDELQAAFMASNITNKNKVLITANDLRDILIHPKNDNKPSQSILNRIFHAIHNNKVDILLNSLDELREWTNGVGATVYSSSNPELLKEE